jgi:hypothetical protein
LVVVVVVVVVMVVGWGGVVAPTECVSMSEWREKYGEAANLQRVTCAPCKRSGAHAADVSTLWVESVEYANRL